MSLDHYTIKAGVTSRLLLVQVYEVGNEPGAITQLRHDTAGLSATYIREGENRVHTIKLIAGELGRFEPGSFVEVNPEELPGLYQFGVPDEMLAPGSERAILMLKLSGAHIEPIVADLVAYDPQDPVRLGMSAISPEGRIAALRGAFPLITAKELAEQEALQEHP